MSEELRSHSEIHEQLNKIVSESKDKSGAAASLSVVEDLKWSDKVLVTSLDTVKTYIKNLMEK